MLTVLSEQCLRDLGGGIIYENFLSSRLFWRWCHYEIHVSRCRLYISRSTLSSGLTSIWRLTKMLSKLLANSMTNETRLISAVDRSMRSPHLNIQSSKFTLVWKRVHFFLFVWVCACVRAYVCARTCVGVLFIYCMCVHVCACLSNSPRVRSSCFLSYPFFPFIVSYPRSRQQYLYIFFRGILRLSLCSALIARTSYRTNVWILVSKSWSLPAGIFTVFKTVKCLHSYYETPTHPSVFLPLARFELRGNVTNPINGGQSNQPCFVTYRTNF